MRCAPATQALPALLTTPARLPEAVKGLGGARLPERPQPRLPEAYAEGVRVRNTFIETPAELSPSLETFFREREVSTCPARHIGRMRGLFQEAAEHIGIEGGDDSVPEARGADEAARGAGPARACLEPPAPVVLSLAAALGELAQPSAPRFGQDGVGCEHCVHVEGQAAARDSSREREEAPQCKTPTSPASFLCGSSFAGGPGAGGVPVPLCLQTALVPPPLDWQADVSLDVAASHMSAGRAGSAEDLLVLAFAPEPQARPAQPCDPALNSSELPNFGSLGHAVGSCKPCAFFHTAGCTNGSACQFCHLCAPGERQRRRKEKLEAKKAARRTRGALRQF